MTLKRERPATAVYLLSAGALLIPSAAALIVSEHFSLPKLLLIGLLSALSISLLIHSLIRHKRLQINLHPALIPLLAFFVLALLSVYTSVNIYISLLGRYGRYEGVLTLSSYLAVFWLAFQHRWQRRDLRILAAAVTIGGLPVSAYAVSQYFGFDPIIWGPVKFGANRAFSTFGNPSLLAGYLVLTLFPALALFVAANKDNFFRNALLERSAYGAAAFLTAAALVATITRGGWVAALTGFIFIIAIMLTAGLKKSALYLAFFLLVIIILILLLASFSYPQTGKVTIVERLAAVSSPAGTVYQRFQIWRAALKAAAARPLLGWGPDNFRVAFARYESREYVRRTGAGHLQDNAHNYLLQSAATMGWPAALLFLLAFLWIITVAVIQTVKTKDVLLIGFITGLLAYFINILFVVNVVGAAFLFWLLLGVALSGVGHRRESIKPAPVFRAILALALAVIGAAQFILPVLEFTADYHHEQAFRRQSRYSPAAALSEYQSAMRINPWLDKYPFQLGISFFYLAVRRSSAADFNNARVYLNAATALDPENIDNLLFQAQTEIYAYRLIGSGDLRQARLILLKLLQRQPLSLSARYLLALAAYESGDSAAAKRWLQRALKLYPAFTDARDLLKTVDNDGNSGQGPKNKN